MRKEIPRVNQYYIPHSQSKPHILMKWQFISVPHKFAKRVQSLGGSDINNGCRSSSSFIGGQDGSMLGLEPDSEFADVTCYIGATGKHAKSRGALLYGGQNHRFI